MRDGITQNCALIHRRITFPGALLLVIFALFSPALAHSENSPAQQVEIGFSLYEIHTYQQDSDTFYCRFELQFCWDPKLLPKFAPENIRFYNVTRDLSIKDVIPKDETLPPGPGKRTATIMVSGYWKGYLDFQNFPFDSHDLPIVFYDSKDSEGTWTMVSAGNWIHNSPVDTAQLDGWTVKAVNFFNTSKAFRHSAPANTDFSSPVFGAFSVDITRNETSHVVRLFIPIIIIWLISYMGLFWDDSSPASRCGTAAIFAGITFALGTNFLNPPVNYLTVMNIVFLGLYTNIGVDFILVTARFWAKTRGYGKSAEIFWWAGVVASPIMLAITALLCIHLAQSRQQLKSLMGPPAATAIFSDAKCGPGTSGNTI